MADVSEPDKAEVSTRKSKRKAANKAKEVQPAVANIEDDNKDENKESPKAESPSRCTSSPDPNCAICLSRLENKSFTDSCFHMFCFVCLVEWSKIKAECPLCKQPFKSIIHNVRSYDDYDQYHLERPENQFSYDTQNDRRFRYRTTMTHDHMFSFRTQRYSRYPESVASLLPTLPTTMTTRQHWRRQRQAATSDFRRRVYLNGMRVVGVQDTSGRSRNASPEFFSSNPATTHRLVPWLNRELNALLYNREEHVQFVLELIMGLIKRFPIQSEDFYQHVYAYIGSHTRHFMHEFETFAKSPYCIILYDQKATYEQQPEFVSDSDSANSSDEHDSDVMIVSPSSASTAPRRPRRDPGAVRQHYPRTEITPVSLSLRDLLEEDDEPLTAHSGWESPIPGPSWHLNPYTSNASSLIQPGTSFQSSSHERKKRRKKFKVKEEADDSDSDKQDTDSNWVDSESESGSDVVCVGYDKPWQERTPVIVSTDSEEDKMIEKAEKNKRRKERMSKKEEASKKSRKRKSRSRSRSSSISRRRMRSKSSSRLHRSRSRSSTRSYSRSHQRHKNSTSRSGRSRSRSASRRQLYLNPSPYSRSRKRNHSIAYEDAFGYSRSTVTESDRRKKKGHYKSSHYSDSSRSNSRSPSKHRRDRYHSSRDSRNKRRSRSSSVEVMPSRHRHKKHKKHKRSRDSDKEKDQRKNVHYKIVTDKESGKKSKGDPLLSITIKRDKSEDTPVVSSTVDTAHAEIEIPENVVIRTEPITPPRPGEISTEPAEETKEKGASSCPPKKSNSPEQNENTAQNKGDSDSSSGCIEVRRKYFKKHPSGHKKSRRPLPRIPDPSTSTVTSSTSVSNSDHKMPVLDAISQLFNGYTNSSITSTQLDNDSIPGMMANFFDSRLSHLYGYPGPSLPFLSDYLPKSSCAPQLTSSDHPLVLSSSDESDVVVEAVKKGSRQTVSSTSSSSRGQGFQGLMYNILDRIPVISDDIDSHRSIDVEEAIDVEELGNESPRSLIKNALPSGAVMEVLDSDDELEVSRTPKPTQQSNLTDTSHVKESDNRMSQPEFARTMSSSATSKEETSVVDSGAKPSNPKENPSFTEGVGSSTVNGQGSCDEDQLVDVETLDCMEPSTSEHVRKSSVYGEPSTSENVEKSFESGSCGNSEKTSKHCSLSDDEAMDIDVTGLPPCQEVCSSMQETKQVSEGICNGVQRESSSEESMDIDVVGGADTPDPVKEYNEDKEAAAVSEGSSSASRTEPRESVLISNVYVQRNHSSTNPAVNSSISDNAQVDSSANGLPLGRLASDASEGINVSSSVYTPNLGSSLPSESTDSEIGSSDAKNSSGARSKMEHSKSSGGSSAQLSESEEEGYINLAPKVLLVEGASEISSEEESFIQMAQPQVLADASDISSEEDSYEEDRQPPSLPATSSNRPQVIDTSSSNRPQVIDTSSDEGEIFSDSDMQGEVVHGANDVSSENKFSDLSKENNINIGVLDSRYRSNSERLRYNAGIYQPSSHVLSYSPPSDSAVPDSRSLNRDRLVVSRDESRSSGELSDDSGDEGQVYDDISSSENFDSPEEQVDSKRQPSPQSSTVVHAREPDESLSEGEIVSD